MDYVEQRMAQEAQRQAANPASYASSPASHPQTPHTRANDEHRTAFLTPLNVALLGLLAYTAYVLLRPAAPAALPKETPPTVFRTFTPRTLLPNNGEAGAPVYLAVRGRVFDVTSGRNFYGPGGPYANFAGRDASRGLAFHSFDEDMLTKDLDGPLDALADLGKEEIDTLRDWEDRFDSKYLVVGRLVAKGDEGVAAQGSGQPGRPGT